MNQRIVWLDALKGIGLFLIMISHLGIPIPYGQYLFDGYIPLFFVAAGFMYKPNIDIAETIKKKGTRLLIPYYIYGFIATLFFNVLQWDGVDRFIRELFGLVYGKFTYMDGGIQLLASAAGPLWFLPAMFLTYILLSIWEKSYRSKLYFVIAILYQIVVLLSSYLLPWSIETIVVYCLFILFGARSKKIFFETKKPWLFILSILFYIVIVYYNDYVNFSICDWGKVGKSGIILCLIMGVTYSYIIAYICRIFESTFAIKVFAFIGTMSLRLMCIHESVFLFTFLLLQKYNLWPGYDIRGYSLQIIFAILVSFLIGKILHRYAGSTHVSKYL